MKVPYTIFLFSVLYRIQPKQLSDMYSISTYEIGGICRYGRGPTHWYGHVWALYPSQHSGHLFFYFRILTFCLWILILHVLNSGGGTSYEQALEIQFFFLNSDFHKKKKNSDFLTWEVWFFFFVSEICIFFRFVSILSWVSDVQGWQIFSSSHIIDGSVHMSDSFVH